jgi:3-oxoacyl-[acyl-carrier protein] reductase
MALTRALADEGRSHNIKVSAICPAGVADELVDASPEEILRSEQIDPFDVAETAVFLATLGKYAVVHQVVIDRLGAEW